MIKPTIGRKVWYSPHAELGEIRNRLADDQYFDATVIFVHSDRVVNLQVVDHRGGVFVKEYVPLLQDGDAPRTTGGHCLWMPYQTGQAKTVDVQALNKHVVESVGTRLMDLDDRVKNLEAGPDLRLIGAPVSTGRQS